MAAAVLPPDCAAAVAMACARAAGNRCKGQCSEALACRGSQQLSKVSEDSSSLVPLAFALASAWAAACVFPFAAAVGGRPRWHCWRQQCQAPHCPNGLMKELLAHLLLQLWLQAGHSMLQLLGGGMRRMPSTNASISCQVAASSCACTAGAVPLAEILTHHIPGGGQSGSSARHNCLHSHMHVQQCALLWKYGWIVCAGTPAASAVA